MITIKMTKSQPIFEKIQTIYAKIKETGTEKEDFGYDEFRIYSEIFRDTCQMCDKNKPTVYARCMRCKFPSTLSSDKLCNFPYTITCDDCDPGYCRYNTCMYEWFVEDVTLVNNYAIIIKFVNRNNTCLRGKITSKTEGDITITLFKNETII